MTLTTDIEVDDQWRERLLKRGESVPSGGFAKWIRAGAGIREAYYLYRCEDELWLTRGTAPEKECAQSKAKIERYAVYVPLFHALWDELFGLDGKTPAEQQAGLASVESRPPKACGCLAHWNAYKADNPPVYGDGWFAWLVSAKNAIRERQGKPTMTVEEVRASRAGG